MSVDTDGVSAVPCCNFRPTTKPFLQNYARNQEIQHTKQMLFQGQAAQQCGKCVEEERNAGKSFRTLANDFHPERSQEVKAHDDTWSSLRYVNVTGSNVCNLQCLPCVNASFKRDQELYNLGLRTEAPVFRKLGNIEAIAELDIEVLTLCSGEPLYDPQSWALLELLVEKNKAHRVRLDINTNLTSITSHKIDWLTNNFSRVLIKGSIDGLGAANDYLRYPSRWQTIDWAVDTIMQKKDLEFVITTALSNLSLIGYASMVRYFLARGVKDFFISQVLDPAALHCGHLPADVKRSTLTELHSLASQQQLTDRTRDAIELAINVCENTHPWQPQVLENYLNKHDMARQTNWREVWPNLAKLMTQS